MPVIKLPLLFVGSNGERHLNSIFNPETDAVLSRIHPRYVNELGVACKLGRERSIQNATGDSFITITHAIALDFYIDGVLVSDEFLVVPDLEEDVIIGAATMRKWRVKLDFQHNTVHVSPEAGRLRLKSLCNSVSSVPLPAGRQVRVEKILQ